MQGHILVVLILYVAFTDAFIFSKNKCPIKKYGSSKVLPGEPLLVNENFKDRVKSVEKAAKDCKVHVYIKGSYYQVASSSQQIPYADYDLVIGHGFRFEIRDESNALLCNKLCLSRTPTDTAEVKCFLQSIASHGLSWSHYNPDVISDNTYASNTAGYSTLKNEIQTNCQNQSFKRELMRALRRMYEEEEENEDFEKK